MVFSFTRLTESSLDMAVALCDECVGANLYPRTYLSSVIAEPNHYFYFMVTDKQEPVGYIYFFTSDLESISAYTKLPREKLAIMSENENPVIGHLKSIGIEKSYRGHQISEKFVHFYLEQLQAQSEMDIAFGVFWKIDDCVPMEKTLKKFDFTYLMDAQHIWYDNKDLICPYCKGACECSAAIYYKPIKRGG